MKLTITTTLLFASLSAVFAQTEPIQLQQGRVALSEEESARVWTQVNGMGGSTKGMTMKAAGMVQKIQGAGIVVEKRSGNQWKDVGMNFTLPGTYVVRGNKCSGGNWQDLEEATWSFTGPFFVAYVPLLNTEESWRGMPYSKEICSIDAFRLEGGIEQLHVDLLNHTPKWQLQVLGEGVRPDGRFYLRMSPQTPLDATIFLGHTAISDKRELARDGSVHVIFPKGMLLPQAGPQVVTVCDGICESYRFEKGPLGSPGKG